MSYKGITLLQIEYFLAVSKYLSFTEAAKRMYTTQPSLSRQISRMETQLGVQLFYRTKRNTRLTMEGIALYDALKGVTEQIDSALKNCRNNKLEEKTVLRIGCFEAMDLGIVLNGILTGFRKKQPNVELILERHSFKNLLTRFESGKLDVIFTLSFEMHQTPGVLCDDIYTQQSCVIMSYDHPLANKQNLKLSSFSEETFIILSRDEAPTIYDGVFELCQQAGFEPKKLVEMSNFESLLLTVEAGGGVAVVDRNIRVFRKSNYSFADLDDDEVKVVMAIKEKNRNPAALMFANYAIEQSQDLG